MNYEIYELSESHQQMLDDTPDPHKVQVSLLDRKNLPISRGTAILPLLLGVGVFWPDSPTPIKGRLSSARYLVLESGEILKLKNLTLCAGSPVHYNFWVSAPLLSPLHF